MCKSNPEALAFRSEWSIFQPELIERHWKQISAGTGTHETLRAGGFEHKST